MIIAPIEKTVTYATSVETLPDAWSFVMAHMEMVGVSPTISIRPVWRFSEDKEDQVFEVSVSAMTEVK